MSRSYGSLGRRSSSAAWQWVVLGLIFGFGCSAVLVLGAIAGGVLSVGGQGIAFGPTATPIIITATRPPITPTSIPTEVLITPTMAEVVIEAPTATPTTDPTELTPIATETLQPTATATTASSEQIAALAAQGEIPPALASIASELSNVDGGQFQMGTTPAEAAQAVRDCTERDGGACTPAMAEDSYPQHGATVSPFRMETTEVTYSQYVTFLNYLGAGSHLRGCDGQPCLATRSESDTSNVTFDSANYDVPDVINDLPVVEVTWFGAKAYCESLGRRLPTEAEWERSARGDDGRVYPWGTDWDSTLAWTNRSAADDAEEGGPVSVESFPLGRSPYGVFNLSGNVAEWVSDWYDARYYYQPESAGPDPVGPPLGEEKVVRGGSWDAVPFFARTIHRQSRRPGDPTPWIGFRCAADIDAPGASTTTSTGADTTNTQPIGAQPIGTPDPATLGQDLPGGSEGDLGAQPTAPPLPTQVQPTAQPQIEVTQGTLAPG
jgi:formylglycine-generating enzyme required for sulfatase activity